MSTLPTPVSNAILDAARHIRPTPPKVGERVLTIFGDTIEQDANKRHVSAKTVAKSYADEGWLNPSDPRLHLNDQEVMLAKLMGKKSREDAAMMHVKNAMNNPDSGNRLNKTLRALGPWLVSTPEQMSTHERYRDLGVQAAALEHIGLALIKEQGMQNQERGKALLTLAAGAHNEAASIEAKRGLESGSLFNAVREQKRPTEHVIADNVDLGTLSGRLTKSAKECLNPQTRQKHIAEADEAWKNMTGKDISNIPAMMKPTIIAKRCEHTPDHELAPKLYAAALSMSIEHEQKNKVLKQQRNISKEKNHQR